MGLGFLEGFGVLVLLSSGVYVWIFNLISLKFLVFNILWLLRQMRQSFIPLLEKCKAT